MGRKFTIFSDHCPIENMITKSRTDETLGNLMYYLSRSWLPKQKPGVWRTKWKYGWTIKDSQHKTGRHHQRPRERKDRLQKKQVNRKNKYLL